MRLVAIASTIFLLAGMFLLAGTRTFGASRELVVENYAREDDHPGFRIEVTVVGAREASPAPSTPGPPIVYPHPFNHKTYVRWDEMKPLRFGQHGTFHVPDGVTVTRIEAAIFEGAEPPGHCSTSDVHGRGKFWVNLKTSDGRPYNPMRSNLGCRIFRSG
jgi:hypothetical protein